MKRYVYKIQWLFPIKGGFSVTERKNKNDLFSTIKILGARSLTTVNFLDRDYKKVANYNSMVQYCQTEANKKTILAIKQELKNNDNILFVELLRK